MFTLTLGTSSAISLLCEYHVVDFGIGQFYTCTATILRDEGNDRLIAINGIHMTGQSDYSVVGFRIRDQNLKYFVKNVEIFFPNLKGINLDMNSISNVTNADLKVHKNLQYLSFRDNQITNLDSDLLDDLPNLIQVSFANNHIKHVGHDFTLPSASSNLFISFENNPCIHMWAHSLQSIVDLKFYLLVYCPPLISQIEQTMESRDNLLTRINSTVHIMEERISSMERIIEALRLSKSNADT